MRREKRFIYLLKFTHVTTPIIRFRKVIFKYPHCSVGKPKGGKMATCKTCEKEAEKVCEKCGNCDGCGCKCEEATADAGEAAGGEEASGESESSEGEASKEKTE